MKKKYLFGMALMASLAFNSCTKEIVIVQEGNGMEEVQQDGQVLTLQVSNSGDGLTTRAGRPLLSSQAKQDIDHIVLYVVCTESGNGNSGKIVLKKTITPDEWVNALDYSTASGHGKQLQISFKGSDNQDLAGDADGITYDIYAVGYKTGSRYTFVDQTDEFDTKLGLTSAAPTTTDDAAVDFTAENFSAVLTNNNKTDEIFAGKVSVKVVTNGESSYITTSSGDSKSDKATLVLNRQVAGVTGYFTNIPAKVGEYVPTHIRLVASGKSNKVHFTSMVNGETDEAATSGTSGVTSVVNGSWDSSNSNNQTPDAPYWANSGETSKEDKGYMVYDIALSEFFKLIGTNKPSPNESEKYTFADMDLDGDGFVGYKDAQYYVYDLGINSDLKDNTNGGATADALEHWETAIDGGTSNITVGSISYSTKALSGFWTNPNNYQTLVAGSVFAGEFIIPFLQSATYNTFELQLIYKDDSNKTYILKNWNVQVPNADMVSSGSADSNIADGITATWTDDSKLKYNIYRNHLYSLGMKTVDSSDPTNPEKPDPKPDPDPTDPDDEDDPVDLSEGQDLMLHVNDNWEIIHEMVID